MPHISDILKESSQLFMGLTETWLKTHKDAELHIDGYQLFRADRKRKKKGARGRLSGGAAAYVRDDIANTMKRPYTFSNGVIELLCLYSPTENLVLAVMYRQPDDLVGGNRSTQSEFNAALEKFNEFLNDLPSPTPNVILGGDFNLPHVDWNSNTMGPGGSKDEKDIFNAFSKKLDDHFLRQYISKPTHIAGNTLDLVFTNNNELIHSSKCLPTLLSVSDHYLVECSTFFKSVSSHDKEPKPDYLSPLDKLNFFNENINWNDLTQELALHDWNAELKGLNPEEMLSKFMEVNIEKCIRHIPEKKSVIKSNPSKIPRGRRKLMQKRRKLILKLEKSTSISIHQ